MADQLDIFGFDADQLEEVKIGQSYYIESGV